ncbi:MAG TPA: hypothetical protein VN004_10070 [Pseudorhodoplanes sp.]|nr:hypothetical protein [Pseudorhodoplanes sp.]
MAEIVAVPVVPVVVPAAAGAVEHRYAAATVEHPDAAGAGIADGESAKGRAGAAHSKSAAAHSAKSAGNKRPAVRIDIHGTLCGRNGGERCTLTLYWNGEEFHPAN